MFPQKSFATLRLLPAILLAVAILMLPGSPQPAHAATPAEIASLTSIYNNLGGAGWFTSPPVDTCRSHPGGL